MMVWVWPPQISISTQGRVVHCGDFSRQGPRNAMVAVFVKILHKLQPSAKPTGKTLTSGQPPIGDKNHIFM